MSKQDLFRRYGTPPSPLHAEVQKVAREAGWTPPWEHEEQQQQQRQKEEQQRQKKAAGQKSGLKRGGRAKLRLSIIRAAYAKLNPTYKHQPFSNDSILALKKEYLSLLGVPRSPTPVTDNPVTDEEWDLLTWTVEKVSGTQVIVSEDRFEALRRVSQCCFTIPLTDG